MVEAGNQPYERINVTSVSYYSQWRGIPVIYQLTDSYIGTLTPASQGNKVFNQLTVYDNTNPY